MLPILNKKRDEGGIAGTIIKNRQPDEKPEEKQDSKTDHAHSALEAIKANDAEAFAEAISQLSKITDEEPHEEGPHVEPHSYDAQNQKAGE